MAKDLETKSRETTKRQTSYLQKSRVGDAVELGSFRQSQHKEEGGHLVSVQLLRSEAGDTYIQCGILDWILQQKGILVEKLVKSEEICSSVSNNVPVSVSSF